MLFALERCRDPEDAWREADELTEATPAPESERRLPEPGDATRPTRRVAEPAGARVVEAEGGPPSPRARPPAPRPSPLSSGVAPMDEAAGPRVVERVERPAPRASDRVVLGLVVNGTPRGDLVVTLRAGRVYVSRGALADLGVGRAEETEAELVALDALAPAVRHRLDERTLVLHLELAPELLGRTLVDLKPAPPEGLVHARDTSAFLNYALHADSRGGLAAFGELGVRVGDALFQSTASGGSERDLVRGVTQIVIDDRAGLVRWTLGDQHAQSGALGGGAFLAGVGFARELGLDPWLVQTPGVSFEGATATPATLDVIVDGALVRRVDVPAGRFELADLPTPTRSGEARYVLRDALGNTHTFTRPFTVSAGALRPGLHDYQYAVGFERTALATESFRYGELLAIGRHRVGLTDRITMGWRAELAPMSALASGGVEATLLLPTSKLDVGVHASGDDDGAGAAGLVAWTMPGQGLDLAVYAVARTPGYRRIGDAPRDDEALLELAGRASTSFGDWRLGLEGRYARMRAGDDHLVGRASLGVDIAPGLDLRVGAGVSRVGGGATFDAMALLSFVPGRRFSATINETIGPDGSSLVLGASSPMRDEVDVGMHATAVIDERVRLLARPEAQTSFGRYQASLAYDDAGLVVTADAAGAIAWVAGGGPALMRPVQDAFVIIDVPDDVEVSALRENRVIGRTSNGRIVVPSLAPYHANRLALAADELGLGHELERTEVLIAPAWRGGARVTFDVRPTRYVRGRVVMIVPGALGPEQRTAAPGRALAAPMAAAVEREVVPAFGRLVVGKEPDVVTSPLGRRAEFELPQLPVGVHQAVVVHRGVRCRTWLEVREAREPIVDLGLVACRLRSEGRS
ncbi:MAG: fimbrial biogenesis outer membrane usher protein [Deltaproteobacteria bacterium]|nr:fimbrial biogenesis outer membrane usher protein [Deltaproteobacteria bacterium]